MLKFKSFADYKSEGHNWITLSTGEYYPDILKDACELYSPVLVLFKKLLESSDSSINLLQSISEINEGWMRIQLSRIFRKYVSPETPVEMLKKKTKIKEICDHFGKGFRPIQQVQAAYNSRPICDETLCALLWEYKERGKKGYDLTERFFKLFSESFPNYKIIGPVRAGRDILMGELFKDYPFPKYPVDFAIQDSKQNIVAIGLARYDGDRGGAQEDDRTGGYANCANEFFKYTRKKKINTKLILLNDGPGLLLGSMWDDYASLEQHWKNKLIVVTLRMVTERITTQWFEL